MVNSDKDRGRSRRTDTEDRGWSSTGRVIGSRTIGRSGGRVTSCAVCTVHVEMRSASFLLETQNQDCRFVSGLALKPLRRVSWLNLKTKVDGFFGLDHKTGNSDLVIWASK
jgi:hypothetical protein